MINDVSAWNMDKEMFETIKKYNVPYVLMHMKGEPKNMQDNPRYENVTKEVIKFFSNKINQKVVNELFKILQINESFETKKKGTLN